MCISSQVATGLPFLKYGTGMGAGGTFRVLGKFLAFIVLRNETFTF